ncbi:alpha/beta fold hydrolase [Croceicoccus hydrothermalis]|uniref:alpha/beta fold hydrolase n=1 Tax=Croceicoccus hydrothermalis TaxID=2867964 RepID=UPI001EFA90DF|nr:alpha/beta fold hydrolase [Croceicoccus hydrothermalis]
MALPDFEAVAARDGTRLAVHRMGEGTRGTVVLLHGLFSNVETNWVKFGHAQKLVDAGFALIMPDLRAHGHSGAPHDPACYPPDVLVRDLEDVIAHYGLVEYDLVGFSLGSRTVLRGVLDGLEPRRLVLTGMGLEGLAGWEKRAEFFRDAIDRFNEVRMGDPAFFAVSFMKTMKVDRTAARLLLGSMADTSPDALSAATMPTLVLCGDKDNDNGSADALADALPDGRRATIPGTHMSSVSEGALGDELVAFLTA